MKIFAQLIILAASIQSILGFVSPSVTIKTIQHARVVPVTPLELPTNSWIAITKKQQQQQSRPVGRQSVAGIQMKGLFGLGFGEIAVILIVVGFVLGPQNIGRLVRSSADRASALKDEIERVPEEFQKGLEEGESNVRARKARVIKVVKDENEE